MVNVVNLSVRLKMSITLKWTKLTINVPNKIHIYILVMFCINFDQQINQIYTNTFLRDGFDDFFRSVG